MAILPPDDTSYGSRPHDRSDERSSRNDGEGTERTGSDRFAEASVQRAADLRRRRGRLKGALLGAAGLAVVIGGGGYLAFRGDGDKNIPTAPFGRGDRGRTSDPTNLAPLPVKAPDKYAPFKTFKFTGTAKIKYINGTPSMTIKPDNKTLTKIDDSGKKYTLDEITVRNDELESPGPYVYRGAYKIRFIDRERGQPPVQYIITVEASRDSGDITQEFTATLVN